ncbi:MAG: tRNA (adenosine(37)-N6)-dimethylallyltransferase MiaA [Bacteroidetes bacterium]|nr:tRNA (adenosine(37)-N6)-dimethylallyltransferase MiaA [Bacteroidota bacterium]
MERRTIIIVGPTCSGKTSVALALALKFETEIISADSRQIYKLLNIGTAKPSEYELTTIMHHFIDYLNPDENYNVSRFEKEALIKIELLSEQNKIPIVTGGSGLYIKALVDGIVDAVDVDDDYREELISIKNEKGIEELYTMLQKVDPESARTMLPQNWKRIIRALEVFKLSGIPIWQYHKEQTSNSDIKFLQFGLYLEREILYDNINDRVDKMIENGLVDEVNSLLESGLSPNLNSLNTVGYKEIISHLNKEITLDRAVELIKRNTRRYAKRQMTWFNKDKRIKWINISEYSTLENVADFIYYEIENY